MNFHLGAFTPLKSSNTTRKWISCVSFSFSKDFKLEYTLGFYVSSIKTGCLCTFEGSLHRVINLIRGLNIIVRWWNFGNRLYLVLSSYVFSFSSKSERFEFLPGRLPPLNPSRWTGKKKFHVAHYFSRKIFHKTKYFVFIHLLFPFVPCSHTNTERRWALWYRYIWEKEKEECYKQVLEITEQKHRAPMLMSSAI